MNKKLRCVTETHFDDESGRSTRYGQTNEVRQSKGTHLHGEKMFASSTNTYGTHHIDQYTPYLYLNIFSLSLSHGVQTLTLSLYVLQ